MGSATTSSIERNEAQRANKFAGMDDAAKQAARDAGCLISVARRTGAAHAPTMFAVDEATATAIATCSTSTANCPPSSSSVGTSR